jgi:hypothetical protein
MKSIIRNMSHSNAPVNLQQQNRETVPVVSGVTRNFFQWGYARNVFLFANERNPYSD